MALETVAHIDDLDASNPLGTDARSQGDNHIRNIKTALKADFPNVDAACNPTPTEFNVLAGVTAGTAAASKAVVLDSNTRIDGVDLVASGSYSVAGTGILVDSSGTMTLSNVDALDATTETTIESAIDSLSNLVTTGALNSGSITSGFGTIDIGSSTLSTTGTITGPSGTWDSGGMDIAASDSYAVAGTDILSDSSGTMTLSNVDALDSTTEATIETAIDTLSNLTTTGALGSGSITSGFGNIDIGSSTIGATGTITGPSGTWDSGGMDIASSDSYAIDGTNVLTATALGTAVASSSLTSVGTLTTLTVDNINLNTNTIASTSGDLQIKAVSGSNLTFQDDADAAKECTLVLSGITSSNDRTITMADQNINLTPNTGTYAAAGSIGDVVDDTSPQLGASLDVQGFGLTSSSSIMHPSLTSTGKALVMGF